MFIQSIYYNISVSKNNIMHIYICIYTYIGRTLTVSRDINLVMKETTAHDNYTKVHVSVLIIIN